MTSPIEFESHIETASFFSPLAGMELAGQAIEVRKDPLTGMTAIASEGLAAKEEMFLGKTDWRHTEELVAASRAGCFFCPEKVYEATPRYPEDLVPGGRLRHGRALVFPNLFPLAGVHAVVAFPEEHFLRPSEFTPGLLEEGLGAALAFVRRAVRSTPGMAHIEVCCNHMLPAGASLVHPHLQVFGGESVPWLVDLSWRRSAEWQASNGRSYWRTLVDQEIELGERYIHGKDGAHWLAPFAPAGSREVIAVVPDAGGLQDLKDAHVRALAGGLSTILAWYEDEGLSAFNFTLFGGPLREDGSLREGDPSFPVVLRVIARSAFKPDYRTDDYFLQKQLGGELMFAAPEEMAARLRMLFAA